MAETSIGILGSQKRARDDATAARNAVKGRYKKYGMYTALVVALLVFLYTFTSWLAEPATQQQTSSAPATQQAIPKSPTTEVVVDWGQGSGKPPVGVWSPTMKVGVGCKVDFIGGNGDVYKVRYRFYSEEWKAHEPGTWPNMSEYQFLLMRDIEQVPVKVTCR